MKQSHRAGGFDHYPMTPNQGPHFPCFIRVDSCPFVVQPTLVRLFSDGNASTSRFNRPIGLLLEESGTIYVADSGNHTIRAILPAGLIITFAGRAFEAGAKDGANGEARFNTPTGLTIDGNGNLIVTDSGNNLLRRISSGGSGTVSTFVGRSGIAGSADGTGTAATFNNPTGVSRGDNGNLYVADTGNHTIRKITPAGVVTTLAGTAGEFGAIDGTGAAARFNSPSGLIADSEGNLLIADTGNSCIRLFTSSNGAVVTRIGRPGADGSTDGLFSSARFLRPAGLAIARDGSVLIADTGNSSLRRDSAAGEVSTLAGPAGGNFGRTDGTGESARFSFPQGLAITTVGDMVVADSASGTLRRVSAAGAVQTVAGGSTLGYADGGPGVNLLNYPTGIALTSDGYAFFSERLVHTVRIRDTEGTVFTVAGTNTLTGSTDATGAAARFNGPADIALSSTGILFVADSANHVIRRIDPATRIVTTFAGTAGSAGSADGTGSAARFNSPRGLCFDSTGNLYVSDAGNHTIRRITPGGVVITYAGSAKDAGAIDGTRAGARFNQPGGLAVDRNGALYIADSGNHTVRYISGDAVVTIGGLAGLVGCADGPGSTARFFIPTGIALDTAGNIFVTESGNNVIVKGRLNTPSSVGRLINLSVLSDIATPGDSFTLGYVVGGTGTTGAKPLVIRAAGESLGALGVPGTLDDPKLETFAGSTKTGENNDWGGSASLTAAMAAVGAFPYKAVSSLDSAVAAQITSRDNSVVVTAANSKTGQVIAEVYDATPAASFATITPRLLNVSVRKNLGTGLTVGFVVGGTTPVKVLIRAVGPGLAQFGVPGTVVDPQLTLFNSLSNIIGQNDDWGGTAELSAAFRSVGAFELATGSNDAAFLATLQPGLYSVQVKGKSNDGGVALVEVYEVP
jgi:sugar lactone lactonase YvrE